MLLRMTAYIGYSVKMKCLSPLLCSKVCWKLRHPDSQTVPKASQREASLGPGARVQSRGVETYDIKSMS